MLTWFLRRMGKRLALGDLLDFAETFRSPCRGVYDTWEEAQRALPQAATVGYDHSEVAPMYLEYTEKLRPSDYPVLFWMKSAIGESSSVFDLGGNIGLECYSFQKYLSYPNDFRWIVCDLPEITRFGREFAQKRNMNRLVFTQDYQDADRTDILLTAGSLQCMETDLSAILSTLRCKPTHLLINRVPLYDGESFYTVRELAVRDLPRIMFTYRVFNRNEFINSILANGYQLRDSWTISEGNCLIPFRPDKSVRTYTGLYFRLSTR